MSRTRGLVRDADAVFAGAALAVLAVGGLFAVIVVVVVAATAKSPNEKALGELRGLLAPGTQVRAESCRRVLSDADFDTFRCVLSTPLCRRSYLFMSNKNASFDNLDLAYRSDAVLVRPCATGSDRLRPGEKPR